MFSSGGASLTYYSGGGGTKSQRSSFGDSLFGSQPESGQRAFDDEPRRKSTAGGNAAANLEPGCLAVTIRAMRLAVLNKTGAYGSSEGCPLALIGWPLAKSATVRTGECSFKISDGTGTALILMDIRSDNEVWLLEKMKELLESDETATPTLTYLRVIGTLSAELVDGILVLRAIHVRPAESDEIAFFHLLSCALTAMNYGGAGGKANTEDSASSERTDVSEKENLLENITLPESHSWCQDPYEIQVLKFLMKYRIPLRGVPREQIRKELPKMGFTDVSRINQAVHELIEAALCLDTEDDCIDILLEGEG